ncbi:hypothetical protein ACQP1V_34485 [Microtetraspora malaysiensis]|uniref:hypothetical protein n=1 Tax=Microtetraspora malaysiensis TaxID=161358 RepID=UPI003D90B59E
MRQRPPLLAGPARWLICLILPLLVSGVPAAGVLGALPQAAVAATSASSVLSPAKSRTAAFHAAEPDDHASASPHSSPDPNDHTPPPHDLSRRPHKAVIGANRGITGAGQTAVLADRRRPTTAPARIDAAPSSDGRADPLAAPGVSPGRAPPITG